MLHKILPNYSDRSLLMSPCESSCTFPHTPPMRTPLGTNTHAWRGCFRSRLGIQERSCCAPRLAPRRLKMGHLGAPRRPPARRACRAVFPCAQACAATGCEVCGILVYRWLPHRSRHSGPCPAQYNRTGARKGAKMGRSGGLLSPPCPPCATHNSAPAQCNRYAPALQ